MKYKYKAKCSQCGRGFFANTRAELLAKLRKHLWLRHREWMIGRIKKGQKKAKKVAGNPRIIGMLEAPIIEKLTGVPYDQAKANVLDFFARMLLSSIRTPK